MHNSVGVNGFFYFILFIYLRETLRREWYGLEGGLVALGVSSMCSYYIFTQKHQKWTRTEQGPQVDSENV